MGVAAGTDFIKIEVNMGWKTLKEHFNIEHIVQVSEGSILIGSGFISDLVKINPATGLISENDCSPGFLERYYPSVHDAQPEIIVELLAKQDTFTASVPVFTYDGANILEKFCEQPGWPNVTHDGMLMHDNTFSTDRNQVVEWAKASNKAHIRHKANHLENLEKDVAIARAKLAVLEDDKKRLEAL